MTWTAAIVVAAGSGERLGAATPKALVQLAGEPMVVHAVRALAAGGVIDETVVVAPDGHAEQVERALDDAGLPVAAVCVGGTDRCASVARGLKACSPHAEVVAVHDAARPLLSGELVRRTIEALAPPWDAVAPAVPLDDTVKLVDEQRGQVLRTVDRRGLWAVQTPQVFGRLTLERVHARIDDVTVTDDLALVEAAGGRVRVIEGERRNFKVTYPEDLAVAEALLARGVEERPT